MCGITGFLTLPDGAPPDNALARMMATIDHRGPDSNGTFCKPEHGLHLGHTRLAIVDLSEAGAQPMTSHSGRYTIVLNGEIYNFRELRAELETAVPVRWRGTSDTEVLLEIFERNGIHVGLQRAEGMFALALWDNQEKALYLARDRFGEKGLYVGQVGSTILFGSELGAVMAYPGFRGDGDSNATDLFLALSYVPEPHTPFLNVRKLPPGTFARFDQAHRDLQPVSYWDAFEVAATARSSDTDLTGIEDRIEQRLRQVIRNQMIADVPLGAFLSGGIDSSLIVALMQEESDRPVNTFTIGFTDKAYDESSDARAVAEHLGTSHTEVMLDWTDALDIVERLPDMYSEPFADSSQLPTHLVSAVARRSVTVALSGDAGDEVFGGYNRHVLAGRYERIRSRLPAALRKGVGKALLAASQPRFDRVTRGLMSVAGNGRLRLPTEKLSKAGAALAAERDLDLYLHLVRRDAHCVGGAASERHFEALARRAELQGLSLSEFMMLMDTVTYLPGDILHKVDRAAMSVSLETRVPYLDHRLFELAWSMPIAHRIRNGEGKFVLRNLLAKRLPRHLFERPKAGFGVPIESWLKGPLKDWMSDLVSAYAAAEPRHAAIVLSARDDFLAGRGHLHHFIWNVVMLQAWKTRHGF
ncbi:asparagine synthase (glutamine-hydrolyzing) [Minwuia sp.]|uniref:asparagine synthase (glutamine-hydrolyzing) n=1 Tax=Minwuia sp. TaxID=2493630 RepID=UPI003A918825